MTALGTLKRIRRHSAIAKRGGMYGQLNAAVFTKTSARLWQRPAVSAGPREDSRQRDLDRRLWKVVYGNPD